MWEDTWEQIDRIIQNSWSELILNCWRHLIQKVCNPAHKTHCSSFFFPCRTWTPILWISTWPEILVLRLCQCYVYLDHDVSAAAEVYMKSLFPGHHRRPSHALALDGLAHVACLLAQPHMAPDDNAQTDQSLKGFGGCFRGSRHKKSRERKVH